jgi:uncharacterized protein involved in exopolysaccharide biosynthesis
MPDEDLIRGRVQPSVPTVRELAMVLFRQRRVFVWAWGIVITVMLLYLIGGDRYQAKMKVLVRPGRADAPVSAQENAPIDLTRLAMTEEELNSEVELLHDDEVLRKVAAQCGSGGRDWFHFLRIGETPAERTERQARQLARKLKVEPVKKTNLIAISYGSGDPERAARVLQALANAYLEKHSMVHRPTGQASFFEQQIAESHRQLEEAESRLLQFTSTHDVVVASQQRDLTLQKLSEVDASYRQTSIDIAETRRRVSELEKELAIVPERTTTQVRTADNPELLRALKSSLLDLELKRTDLLTKYEPGHPLVQEVEKQIAQAQSAIAAEAVSPIRDETTDKNAQHEWATSELQRAEVQWRALEARAAATGAQEAAYRTLARQLGDDAITQDDLVNAERAAEDNYLLYVKKQEEARMEDALDQRGIANVAIAEQPVAPALPVWSTFAVLAAGFFAAGAAGTGAAFAADHIDPAFRTPDDVLAYLDTPVLASLPRGIRGRISA